jgi:hypothetical protein
VRRVSREAPWQSALDLFALFLLAKKIMTTTGPTGRPATRTDSTATDVEAALLAAGAPLGALKILTAQSAHETNGWKGMWNWNVGNVTTASSNFVLQPGLSLHFATYPSLAAGAKAFVDLLKSDLYAGAIALAEVGDLAGFVSVLKRGGYAGNKADYTAYEAAMARWMSQLA